MKDNPIVGQGTSLQQWQGSRRLAELPAIDVLDLVPLGSRAVIIAPHPDDEVLGCGGIMQLLAAAGRPLQLISVTDGSASHPGSQRWTVERLSVVRPQESAEALRRLGLPMHSLKWLRGGFTDTQVAAQETGLSEFIAGYLHASDVVFTTRRQDGHSDHEAVGRASVEAARRVGATCHELPVWTALGNPGRRLGAMGTRAQDSSVTHAHRAQTPRGPRVRQPVGRRPRRRARAGACALCA